MLRGPFCLRKFVILRHNFFGSDSKLMELQNFSQLIVNSWFIFGPNFFLATVKALKAEVFARTAMVDQAPQVR